MRSTERAARNFIRQRLGIDYDIVVVGSATGVIEDANIPGNVNVRIKASNGFMVPFSVGAPKNKIPLQVGDAVELAYSRGKLRIVGIDPDGVLASGGNPIAKITDTDFSKQENLSTLAVTQTQTASTTVKIKGWNPIVNGTAYEFPGGEIDIATANGGSSYIPSSGNMAYIVIFVKNDYLTLEAKSSTARSMADVDLNIADINEAIALRTAGSTPVWAIPLSNAQTTITQNDIRNGRDLRNLVNNLDTYPSGALTVYDSLFTVQDNAAPTKQFQFQASGITAGQTRVYTVPDYNATLATLAGTETLTNKTLTDPTVSGNITQLISTKSVIITHAGTADATVTLPSLNVTLIGYNASGQVVVPDGTKFMPASNSTTALNIANAAGTSFVTFDSTNSRVLFADGAVGAPAMAFSSDPDTGVYRSSADRLGFATGGVQAGIAILSGTTRLWRIGDGTNTSQLYITGASAQSRSILFSTGTGVLPRWSITTNATAETGSDAGSDFSFTNYNDAGSILTTPIFIKRSSGNVGIGSSDDLARLYVVNNDAVTNAVTNILVIGHNSTGTPAAGFGTGLRFIGESSTTPDTLMAQIAVLYPTATHASRTTRITFNLTDNAATRTPLTLDADGSVTYATFGGGRRLAVRVVTAAGAVTVTNGDDVVVVNKTVGAATTVNLPAGVTGQVFEIKDGKGDAATNNITITPAAGNIDGAGTLVLNTNYGKAVIVYNGTEWNQI